MILTNLIFAPLALAKESHKQTYRTMASKDKSSGGVEIFNPLSKCQKHLAVWSRLLYHLAPTLIFFQLPISKEGYWDIFALYQVASLFVYSFLFGRVGSLDHIFSNMFGKIRYKPSKFYTMLKSKNLPTHKLIHLSKIPSLMEKEFVSTLAVNRKNMEHLLNRKVRVRLFEYTYQYDGIDADDVAIYLDSTWGSRVFEGVLRKMTDQGFTLEDTGGVKHTFRFDQFETKRGNSFYWDIKLTSKKDYGIEFSYFKFRKLESLKGIYVAFDLHMQNRVIKGTVVELDNWILKIKNEDGGGIAEINLRKPDQYGDLFVIGADNEQMKAISKEMNGAQDDNVLLLGEFIDDLEKDALKSTNDKLILEDLKKVQNLEEMRDYIFSYRNSEDYPID